MMNKSFMTVEDVAEEMGISKSYAYKVIKQLNEELQQMGYLTVPGRVNTNYFRKRICIVVKLFCNTLFDKYLPVTSLHWC